MMKLTKEEQSAIEFYALDFAESSEEGAGWFAYTTEDTPDSYPGTSCECVEDVALWHKQQLKQQFAESVRPLWSFIGKQYQWLVVDKWGHVFCHANKPIVSNAVDDWTGQRVALGGVAIPVPNGMTWRDTLVRRPCSYDPTGYSGGMHHCPVCGEMVLGLSLIHI